MEVANYKKNTEVRSKQFCISSLFSSDNTESLAIFKLLDSSVLNLSKQQKRKICSTFKSSFPSEHRHSLWLKSSGALQFCPLTANYYQLLLKLATTTTSTFDHPIRIDISRTFQTTDMNTEENRSKLSNVLSAFTVRNPTIGYCQGFNLIVAKLLKSLESEENSFFVLCRIVENILPMNYFADMKGVLIDATIMKSLVKLNFPQLYKHLSLYNLELEFNNIFVKWLSTLFIQYASESVVI